MVLKLKHFDTKTKQNTRIEEKVENTLAEYLFRDVKFSIGTAYPEATIPQDLQEYNGMTLQFCAGKRMYFANDPTIRLVTNYKLQQMEPRVLYVLIMKLLTIVKK